MSTLGKVLILLNLLAAAAFAYFALENYKIRKQLTFVAFRNEVQLQGIPLESGPASSSADFVSFPFKPNAGTVIDSIPKKTLDEMIPKGGTVYGGEAVASQQEEITRLHKLIVKPDLDEVWLKVYLTNLARSGAQRDGYTAIMDMATPRALSARKDLPFAARTPSQQAALGALVEVVDLGDPQAIPGDIVRANRIAEARAAIKRFVISEAPYGAAADGIGGLASAIDNACKPGSGQAEKDAIIAKVTQEQGSFGHVADLAINPLTSKADVDAAQVSIKAFLAARKGLPSEGKAVADLFALITFADQGPALTARIKSAGTAILDTIFEDCEAKAKTTDDTEGDSQGEKSAKIAHVLYHIDAHRHADANTVADRQEWHQRVSMIVGLPTYIRVAEAQAKEYTLAYERLAKLISVEQTVFLDRYNAEVARCITIEGQLLTVQAQLDAQSEVTAANTKLKEERQTERDGLLKDLKDSQEAAKASLEQLQSRQEELIAVQKQLRDARTALLELEKKLREIEVKD